MTRIRQASLLIVLAHPDDEIFHGGVLAHLSEQGVCVTLVCATNGEAGRPHPSVGPVEDLGGMRARELEESCGRLGIAAPVLLRFHDSARKDRQRHDDPHALANVDMLDVEATLRALIGEVRPHVIVTFEPHGAYYHPDHLAIHRATTAAFFSSGALGPDAPERLFYATLLSDTFRVLAEANRGGGITDGLDPSVFGTHPNMVAVSFDATPYLERKFSAMSAHRSAFGAPPAEQLLRAFRPVLEREVFVLGGARGAIPNWPLKNFFDGLETADFQSVRRDSPE
jgi:N-acetyl-1-D-myo-inositol-2-amino-2-deoxy-alpha-D-glucopyranoside deacetylase